MSVEQIIVDSAASTGEPIAAVVVEAGAGNIKRVIVEKVGNTALKTGLMIAGGAAVVGGVSYLGFKGYKKFKAFKAKKAEKAAATKEAAGTTTAAE